MFGFWYKLTVIDIEQVDIEKGFPRLRVTCEVASRDVSLEEDSCGVKLPSMYRVLQKLGISKPSVLERKKRRKLLSAKRSLCTWEELEEHVLGSVVMLDEDIDISDFPIRYALSEISSFQVLPDFRQQEVRTQRVLQQFSKQAWDTCPYYCKSSS
jgi:hypothetical protein